MRAWRMSDCEATLDCRRALRAPRRSVDGGIVVELAGQGGGLDNGLGLGLSVMLVDVGILDGWWVWSTVAGASGVLEAARLSAPNALLELSDMHTRTRCESRER